MTSPDPSGWTSEPPDCGDTYHLEVDGWSYIGRVDVSHASGLCYVYCSGGEYEWSSLIARGLKRSILPVPSAERHAALEAVAEAAAALISAAASSNARDCLEWSAKLTAAFARLEATR